MTRPLHVLIVEDSDDDTLLLARLLRKSGYDVSHERVDTARDMEAALDREIWDLVVADFAMPRFNGFAALKILQRRGLDVPCVVVSGTMGEETAVAVMKAGAADYIMKDNLKRLVPAIDRELREAEMRRERRRAEKDLQETRERYRSLVDNIDIGVTLIDSDHEIVMTNAAQAKMFRTRVEDFVGRKCYEAFKNRDKICGDCPAVEAMRTGKALEVERECSLGDDKNHFVRVRAFPTFDAKGSANGCIKVLEDITHRKLLEEQLRQASQLEAIGRLAGGVAHDFNNLLTAMMGYSEVLLQEMPGDNPFREKVSQISQAAGRAAELTRQLLAFSRKQVLDMKVLDLNPIVSGLKTILQRLLGETVELTTFLDPNLKRVNADRSQIEQILLNLAVNARDAMPHGGKLIMETSNVFLDENYVCAHADVRTGPQVMFAVTDSGTGMDAETASRIFDPFFTTKERGKGTGLGLSTAYGIVKQHQGHICVYTEPGNGTTFKIYLPAVEGPVEQPAQSQAEPWKRGGDETVLLVEDEDAVRSLAKEALEMLGYSVLDASSAEEALKISESHRGPIHLLLTDVILPRMDGAGLFHGISAQRPETRVLYVSGYTRNSIVDNGILKPGIHFLQKPFTLSWLAGKVREVLDEAISLGERDASLSDPPPVGSSE